MQAHIQPDACEVLSWDSEFFGVRIGRVLPDRITPAEMPDVLEWGERNRIACLYLLAAADDPSALQAASMNGFEFVDLRMTFAAGIGNLRPRAGSGPVHRAKTGDVPRLREIARVSHRDTRFYFDWRFDRERCDALYETWIERSCGGHAQAVLVADRDGEAAGYCTCHMAGDTGSIGLIAVSEKHRGQGAGSDLISAAVKWFRGEGARQIRVVTQGRNLAAQRLYQRSGFVTDTVQVWYHRWNPAMSGMVDVKESVR